MNQLLTRVVVERIQNYLGDCSQKVVCRYLGVTPVALSQNIERPFSEIYDNKVGLRLKALLYILECSKKDETLEVATIHRILTLPAFKGKDGWMLDVVSAIHDEYPSEMLVEVFNHALTKLRKPIDQVPVSNGLYNEIQTSLQAQSYASVSG